VFAVQVLRCCHASSAAPATLGIPIAPAFEPAKPSHLLIKVLGIPLRQVVKGSFNTDPVCLNNSVVSAALWLRKPMMGSLRPQRS
jgi:hypothetical protein